MRRVTEGKIFKTLCKRRFWAWFLPICCILGHDKSGVIVSKSRIATRGDYGDCLHYYCKRCSMWWNLDEKSTYQIWVRSLPARLFHEYIKMPINRRRNRKHFEKLHMSYKNKDIDAT